MTYRRIVLGVCLFSITGVLSTGRAAGSDFSVASLSNSQTGGFEQQEVIFIQQYYSYAPKFFIDDIIKKEKALPAGVAATIVRGKPLPKALVPFIREAPDSVSRNLRALPRGLERSVLGTRFLLLDSRMIVRDLVHLPTVVATDRRK
jgi:hypothetical protein